MASVTEGPAGTTRGPLPVDRTRGDHGPASGHGDGAGDRHLAPGAGGVRYRYDWTVGTNTVISPGGDAAVMRIKGTRRGVAFRVQQQAAVRGLGDVEPSRHQHVRSVEQREGLPVPVPWWDS